MPSRRRPRAGLVRVLAAAALCASNAAAQCVSHAPHTLSTVCDSLCAANAPCLAFNASITSSGGCDISDGSCVTEGTQQCAFLCFDDAAYDQSFVFLVGFGAYESAAELAARKRDGERFAAAVAALPNGTDAFASVSNDDVTTISTLELAATTTQFTLAGGSSATRSVQSKVAKVSFLYGALTNQAQLTSVTLRNLDLSDDATLDALATALPTSILNLTLANVVISDFPVSLLTNFSQLATLNLDLNDLVGIAGTDALLGLQQLSVRNNSLQVFRAVFPHLQTLHLEDNNLTDIPAAVFVHGELSELYLKGNPLSTPSFTTDEVTFLTSLTVLDLSNSDFASPPKCCATAQRAVHNLTVCVTDLSNDDDDDSSDSIEKVDDESNESSVTAVVVGSIGGAVLVVLLAITGVWLFLARHRQRRVSITTPVTGTHTKWAMRDSLFGGGVSPPLGRSQLGSSAFDDNYTDRVSTRSTHSNNSSVFSVWSDPELLSVQVRFEDIEDIGTVGSGASGVIWLVKYRKEELLASKRLRADQVTKQRTQDFVEEIKLVAALEHPNIVRFVGAAWTIESNLQALFEYMENGDLRDYLLSPTSPRNWTQELVQLAIDIVEAFVYVHSFTPPLLHRDLKSRNVLLNAEYQAKLTDFGTARYKSVNDTMTAGVGTGRWLAPEVIQGNSDYDQSADMYSLGVVLAEMDTHALPYDRLRSSTGHQLADIAILQMVATGQLRPTFTIACPAELKALAMRCMAQRPQDRPPAHVVAYELRTLKSSLATQS